MNIQKVADDAYSRYMSVLGKIESTKQNIWFNRKGYIPLSEITQNSLRLSKRIEREGAPDPQQALERINGTANFQDVCVVQKLKTLGASVCRIEIPSVFGGTIYGTGFLIAPDLIITNHHVFPSADDAKNAIARFYYELDESLRPAKDLAYKLRPDIYFQTSSDTVDANDPFSGLDFSVVAVEKTSIDENIAISSFPFVRLDGGPGKIVEGENCVVIQHPQGDYKKIVLKDIRLLASNVNYLVYESDTLPGSSGSVVIGLGTGEVVALHHSGVPRKNAEGKWLRKDGSVAAPGDPDNVIDWLGNEGIRINSILDAINEMPLAQSMEAKKKELLSFHILATQSPLFDQTITPTTSTDIKMAIDMKQEAYTLKKEESSQIVSTNNRPATQVQYFEIVVSDNPFMQASWEQNYETLVPGIINVYPLFPLETDKKLKRHFILSMNSSLDPWEQAALIENLPEIEKCVPDLDQDNEGIHKQESFLAGGESDSDNWANFKEDWKSSKFCKQDIANNNILGYRKWSYKAIKTPSNVGDLENNLSKLKFFQLDTGYSDLTKNTGGYDFINDYDSIDDDDDARDLESHRLGRHPDHGTRTASLVIGTHLAVDTYSCDGNEGILTSNKKPLLKLIPYRISNSVILLSRGRSMVDGATRAMANGADVMFMCMGSYPRPMFNAVARAAYDKGIIWICAAGNEVKVVIAPAMYPGTIAVAAINPDYKPWKGSSRGPEVDIAAPGERVYVPFFKDDRTETMRFGNGTSYATPLVASAAMLWKAKHLDALSKYDKPWQIVEAFRYCLQHSATTIPENWDDFQKKNYGAGLLNIEDLLKIELPNANVLKYAYEGVNTDLSWDLGVIESVAKIWMALAENISGEESAIIPVLTTRGRAGLNAMLNHVRPSSLEAVSNYLSDSDKQKILQTYFSSFTNPIKYTQKVSKNKNKKI